MTSNVQFTKMQALGNDFVVIDASIEAFKLDKAAIIQLANRHTGIGFDQLLVLSNSEQADYRYQIFNADGSEVAQCGNGARAIARYIARKHPGKHQISVQTNVGVLALSVQADEQVRVNMGAPVLTPERIPLSPFEKATQYAIEIDQQTLHFGAVSMGNPHAVFSVDDIDQFDLEHLARCVQSSAHFPDGVNVGIMQRKASNEIMLRVFERGAGETLACGSGACAAVVVGRLLGALDETVLVHLPGGTLSVSWQAEGQPVWMTGPAYFVFDGQILPK